MTCRSSLIFIFLFCAVSISLGDLLDSRLDSRSPASVKAPRSKTVAIFFGVCGGMFNMYISISKAIWMVLRLAERLALQDWHDGASVRLELVLPQLYDEIYSPEGRRMPPRYYSFDHFFNDSFLRAALAKHNVSVVHQGTAHCPHKLNVLDGMIETDLLIARLANWDESCPFVAPWQKRNISCMMFVSTGYFAFMSSEYLVFSSRLQFLAHRALRRLPHPFGGIHLRIERDMHQYAYPKDHSLNYTRLEQCLLVLHPNITTLYVAAGSEIFSWPNYLAWNETTKLNVFNKTDIFTFHWRQLKREEWAALEALILLESATFFGMRYSTLSGFVTHERTMRYQRWPTTYHQRNRTVFWNRSCSGLWTRGI